MKINFESKVFVPSSVGKIILKVILNVIMAIVSLIFIFTIIMEGFVFEFFRTWLIVSIIVLVFDFLKFGSSYYAACIVEMTEDNDKIDILYKLTSKEEKKCYSNYTVNKDNALNFEYSDKLQCLRIIGNCRYLNKNGNWETCREILIYILSNNRITEILEDIEKNSKRTIKYMDR